MKPSRLMHERIRRSQVLFKELGYDVSDVQASDESFSASFCGSDGFQAGFFIDSDSKFLELAYSFSFGNPLADFVRERMEDLLHSLYEFGCYLSLQVDDADIVYTVFSKIYFAGLNYFALKETIRDFREAVEAHQEILDLQQDDTKGAVDGDS